MAGARRELPTPAFTFMLRQAAVLILLLSAVAIVAAQSDTAATRPSAATPETAFISPEKYTNAFFGFVFSLPQDAALHALSIPSRDSSRHFLFGLQAQRNGLTAFTITANQSGGTSSEDVRKTAAGAKGHSVKRIEIGGKEFWKSEAQDKSPAGKMRTLTYATAVDGYVLQFMLVSFDSKLTDELQHSIEGMTFFDPAKTDEIAGHDSRPYVAAASVNTSAAAVPSSKRIGNLSPGVVKGNTYLNDALGIDYQFPDGWVVNDKATQDKVIETGHQFAWGNSPSAAREHEAFQQCARVLLFTTQYPEGTKTEEVNPLIVLMAFDPECSPGARFPTSIDERDAIKQVAQQIVRSFAGTPFIPKGKTSVNAFVVQGHLMLDFSGDFTVSAPGRNVPQNIFTSFVFAEAKDYWVAWGFMSGSQSGLQELKNTKIAFASVPATQPQEPKP